MHESAFSYNLSRPYPYRWFTWATVIGGIVLTAFFSVINLAAVGYETNSRYVTDLNVTENPPSTWYMKAPWSWASKVSPTCESATIAVGSQIYSNNSIFQYTVTGLAYEVANGSHVAPSITYRNHPLSYCNVTTLSLYFSQSHEGFSVSSLTANLICVMYTEDEKIVYMHLTTTVDDTVSWLTSTKMECNLQPNLCWVKQLSDVGHVWALGVTRYSWVTSSCDIPPCSPRATFVSSIEVNASTTLTPFGGMPLNREMFESIRHSTQFIIDDKDPESPAWGLVNEIFDHPSDLTPFARTFVGASGWSWFLYSLLLSDLGQSDDSNIFASVQLLPFVYNTTYSYARNSSAVYNDTTKFYQSHNMSLPRIQPAFIPRQYSCRVPKLKSIGTLIVSVIVANLVFLQALWTMFTFSITYFLARRHPEAMSCATCAQKLVTCTEDKDGPVLDTRMIFSETGGDYDQARNTDELERRSSPISSAKVRSPSRHERDRECVALRSIPSIRERRILSEQPLLDSHTK